MLTQVEVDARALPAPEPPTSPVGGESSTHVALAAAFVAVSVGLAVGMGYELYAAVVAVGALVLVVSFYTRHGLLYFLVLVPFGESLSVGPMTVGRVMAVLIVALLGIKFIAGKLPLPPFPPITWLPAAGVVLMIVASGLWAGDFAGWTFAMGQIALAIAFFAAFALLVDDPAVVLRLLRVYVTGAVFAAAIGIVQFAADARATGLQGDANIYSLYQVAAVPAAVALARASSGRQRLAWSLATAPILVSVVASQSRGALLALVAATVCLALLHRRRLLLVPLIAAAGLAATYLAPLVDDRYAVERINADRASGRIDIWFTAWHAFLEQPWTGIGAGNFVSQSIERLTTEPGVELIKSHLLTGQGIEVHNIYLESLAERGVFGLATLAAFLLATLWCLWLAARRHRTVVIEALIPMFVAFCVAAVFLSVINSKLLWMLAGLAAALLVIPAQNRLTSGSGPASEELR